MTQGTISNTRWLMSAVSHGLLKGFATLFFVSIVASLIAGILPLGGFSSVPGLFVAVGIAGYYWWENWPPWPPKAIRKVDDLPSREKIEQAAKDARDHREITKAVSFVDPADVAEAISLLEADASRFPIDELNHVSFIINAGIQVPGDAEQVLAQLVRLEGDDVELIFDGAGTQWIPELEDEDSDYYELYQTVRDDTSVCDYCSGAFGVQDAVADAGLVTLDDHDGHPSIRSLVDDDYEIITF